MPLNFFWFNVFGFNLSWFGLILLGNSFIPIAAVWLALHCYFCKDHIQELTLITLVTALGIILDSCLLQLSIFEFNDQGPIIPFWLITLWACFAATIRHSLAFLQKHPLLPIFVGGIMVPLSYFAGEKLGAVIFPCDHKLTFLIIAIEWMILLSFVISLIKEENKSYA